MSREPSYPEDAPVGEPQEPRQASAPCGDEGKRKKQLVTGAAIGIGSAAIVAALLYANRSKRDDKAKSPPPPRD